MFSAKQVLDALAEALGGERERASPPTNGAPGEGSAPYAAALTRNAEQILKDSPLTAPLSEVVRRDAALAAYTVVNEIVRHASGANIVRITDLGLLKVRDFADVTLFFLLLPVVAAELEAEGVRVDPARVASYHLPFLTAILGGEETATRTTELAANRAAAIVNQADREPQLKQFIETFWLGVRAYVWSGNKDLLDSFTPLYLTFLRGLIPGAVARPVAVGGDSA